MEYTSETHEQVGAGVSVACPKCGSKLMHRIMRFGFWREKVLPALGYYPWECKICRRESLIRSRGERRYRSKKAE